MNAAVNRNTMVVIPFLKKRINHMKEQLKGIRDFWISGLSFILNGPKIQSLKKFTRQLEGAISDIEETGS